MLKETKAANKPLREAFSSWLIVKERAIGNTSEGIDKISGKGGRREDKDKCLASRLQYSTQKQNSLPKQGDSQRK
jgi:hypothetical protein